MRAFAFGFSLSACLLAPSAVLAGSTSQAHYTVTFERTWSAETHPQDFPLLAHFSPVIGLTHDAGSSPFHPGATASDGVEHLCEEGKHQPLDAEIRQSIDAGHAGALIETADPIREAPGDAVATFEIDSAHPMVSIAAMIAPSPDWCAVASDVSLMEGGDWVATRTVTLYGWDVGTDSATTYRAFDADMKPRGSISQLGAPYFARNGQPTPVGQVTFVRQ